MDNTIKCPKCGTEFCYFNDVPVIVDDDVLPGRIEFRGPAGTKFLEIKNLKEEDENT